MPQTPPTIALIHATPAAMAPARTAFAERFPQARLWNLLDDLLISEAEEAGSITPPLHQRMEHLIEHAVAGGADAVLLTCSMYGGVAHAAAPSRRLPVLASDDALFDRVAEHRPATVAVHGPVAAGVDDTVTRLRAHLGPGVAVEGTVVDGAAAAARSGELDVLEELMIRAARAVEDRADAVVIGQFSLSPAVPAVSAAVSVPVLSPAHLAADVLRSRLTPDDGPKP